MLEIEFCHPLPIPQWALAWYGILFHKQGLHISPCTENTHYNLMAENTVPAEYVNRLYWEDRK